MIQCLRVYINDRNKNTLETGMMDLKQSLDFDSTAIDHLHLALYSFQVCLIFEFNGFIKCYELILKFRMPL